MNKLLFGTMLPLLAAGLVAGCGSKGDKSGAEPAQVPNSAAAAGATGDCSGGKVVKVGDKVTVNLANSDLHWDASGSFVTLAKTDSSKQVELMVSTGGSNSPATGDCLRSGSFIRFASTKRPEPDRHLQAYQGSDNGGDAHHVVIGNFPNPSRYSNFSVLKVSGAVGSVIERGDELNIRGTQNDPWTAAPNPVAGAPVDLVRNLQSDDPPSAAAKWTFGKKGDDN